MKAAVYKKYGSPDVLSVEEVDDKRLKDDDDGIVLIKVHSASVNPYDYLFRKGYLPTRMSNGWTKPKTHILGIDVAGTVVAVSKNVDRFKVGDRVFGNVLGSHAEYVRARQTTIALIPNNIGFDEAAAVPTAALTSLQALRDIAQIKNGQKLLVYGASGGIGHFAVQLGKYYETEVHAVCSTANLDWVKALGADKVIDYTKEDFSKTGQIYDIILDAVGKRSYFSCKPALSPTGFYISEHPLHPFYNPLQLLFSNLTGDKRAKIHLSEPNAKDIDFLAELLEQGKLKPVIERCYPLAQIVEAHRHVESGRTKGKVVLEVFKG